LEGEKPLKFFKKYMRNNCRFECLANKTVAVCGCAQFFMVRDITQRICDVNDMKCYKKAEEELSENSCDCLLGCGEIEYKTEQTQNDFSQYRIDRLNKLEPRAFTSIMEVYFISSQFFPFILQQQLTVIDFLSYCGGSLGLFLGFSLISAIEIVYYFTLRVLCVKSQRNRVEPEESDVSNRVNQRSYLSKMMESSTIHGLNQVAKENRSSFERHVNWLVFSQNCSLFKSFRLCWVVIVALAMILGSSTTVRMFFHYQNATVLMKYEEIIENSQQVRMILTLSQQIDDD
jgi:hypothetical protein